MFRLVTNVRLMRVLRRVIDELKAAGFKTNSDVRSPRLMLTCAHSENADGVSRFSSSVLSQDALQELMGLTQEIRKKKIDDPNKREKPDKEDS